MSEDRKQFDEQARLKRVEVVEAHRRHVDEAKVTEDSKQLIKLLKSGSIKEAGYASIPIAVHAQAIVAAEKLEHELAKKQATINDGLGEYMRKLREAMEDKIAELVGRAATAERRRDLAEQCENGMERVCANERNRAYRAEQKIELLQSELESIESEIEFLAKETGFEEGQQRKGGLPGEEATVVDHALEQFGVLGEQLVKADKVFIALKNLIEVADNARTALTQGAIGISKEKADQEYVEMLEVAAAELITALRSAKEQVKDA